MTSQEYIHNAFFTDYPAEAARILDTFAVSEVFDVLSSTTARNAASLLSRMTPSIAAGVLRVFPDELLRRTVAELDAGVSARLLDTLGEEERSAILSRLPDPLTTRITECFEYPDESAGNVMDTRVFAVPEDLTIDQAIALFRNQQPRESQVHVIDRTHRLVGILALRDLLIRSPHERLRDVMQRDVAAIHSMEDRERIVELFDTQRLAAIPVVDLDGHLLGVIRNRQIVQASQEEATADMQTMVGVSKDERALSPMGFSIRKRLPWLEINLVTAFLAAFVVGLFESTIAQFTALAVLLPVVAGQSGNTGAQALAVVMRGLALRDIRSSQWFRVTSKEAIVAFVNGMAVAATTSLVVYVWSRSFGLSAVIGVAMVISMVMAGLAGAVIPMALQAINQDPAQSSSIILTTVTDIVGFLSFLGLATIFASVLV